MMEKMMPLAAIGPSALLEFRSENSRHSRPTVTVPPEAMIGSRQPRQAVATACQRDWPWLSASLCRATSSSE